MRAIRPCIFAILQFALAAELAWAQAHELTCPRMIPKDSSGPPPDLCDKVYRVDCDVDGSGVLSSSGFLAKYDGQVGILTALHGVAGCRGSDRRLTANKVDFETSLILARVDIEHDVAFLTNKLPAKQQLPANLYLTAHISYENELKQGNRAELRIVGYPQSLEIQIGFAIMPQDDPLVKLAYLLPGSDRATYKARKSPDVEQFVLNLSGPLQAGFSGAPILNREGEVVAVADGGLGAGSEIGWAIPISHINWKDANSPENDFRTLSSDDRLLTSYTQPTVAPAFYFADSREVPGAIHKLQGGMMTEVFRRPSNNLYSVAVSPTGVIFFCNANEPRIYKIENGHEQLVYTHSTYVRSVGFDSRGTLYFSESTGAGGDGKIYRLDGSTAAPFYSVRLADIDGYWAGDFAFDRQGTLWLSSGNRRPANLYKVVSGSLSRLFTSADSIDGISFASDGSLLYAGGGHAIYRLAIPSYKPDLLYESPANTRLTGVAPLPR